MDDYHAARELVDASGRPSGRWIYSCLQDGRVRPIGYCSRACAHRSAAEAEAHYREYLLDHATFDGRWQGVEYRCEVCGAWTDRFAQTAAFAVYRLCPAHLNPEGLSAALDGAGAEWAASSLARRGLGGMDGGDRPLSALARERRTRR